MCWIEAFPFLIDKDLTIKTAVSVHFGINTRFVPKELRKAHGKYYSAETMNTVASKVQQALSKSSLFPINNNNGYPESYRMQPGNMNNRR